MVGCLTGRGPINLIRVPKNVKVNSTYFCKYVIDPIVEQLKVLYGPELYKVFIHFDKATSHVSKQTTDYLRNVQLRTGLEFISKETIPVKSPDASPMDFFGFGFLKQQLGKRKIKTEKGLWKVINEEWSQVTSDLARKVFESWKRRLRAISQSNGGHIEQSKKIHQRKVSL